jgi:hypothetical protein
MPMLTRNAEIKTKAAGHARRFVFLLGRDQRRS